MTKTRRVKLCGPAISSRSHMERVVAEICELTIHRDAQKAAMDKRLMEIREEYETSLADIQKELDMKMAIAMDWAEANQGEFAGRKSIEMIHGIVGYRVGNPKLKTLTGWTWDKVLETLKAFNFKDAIRVKEEVDKEFILANRENISAEKLRSIGCRVIQEETFYVEPSREPSDTKRISAKQA